MIQNSTPYYLQASWLAIYNPASANGKLAKRWPIIEERLKRLLPNIEIHESTYVGAATDIIADAVARGVRHVMAVGGDGIAHQVVNGIMLQETVGSSEVVFCLLPFGTGNDWIKSHDIPRKWSAWKAYFLEGDIGKQNVGSIIYGNKKQRYFINVAGLAYDAFVVHFLNNQRHFLSGKLLYFISTLKCLFRFSPQEGTILFNGKKITQQFYTINLGIGRYSGGGMQLVPHATPQGKCFALTYVGAISRLAVVLNSFRFYEGRIASYSRATLAHTDNLAVFHESNHRILIEADGEYLGESPARIQLIQAGLSFVKKRGL